MNTRANLRLSRPYIPQTLHVNVVEARGLMARDGMLRRSDPYVNLDLSGRYAFAGYVFAKLQSLADASDGGSATPRLYEPGACDDGPGFHPVIRFVLHEHTPYLSTQTNRNAPPHGKRECLRCFSARRKVLRRLGVSSGLVLCCSSRRSSCRLGVQTHRLK